MSSSPAQFIWLKKAITDKAVYSEEDTSERNWYFNWWATFLPLYMRYLCQKHNRFHVPARRNNTHKPHQLLSQKESFHLQFYSLLTCPSTSTCPICHTLWGQHVHKPMSRLSSSICRFFPIYGGYSIDNSLKLISNPDVIWFVINAIQPMSLIELPSSRLTPWETRTGENTQQRTTDMCKKRSSAPPGEVLSCSRSSVLPILLQELLQDACVYHLSFSPVRQQL